MKKIHGGEQVLLKVRVKVTKVIEKDVAVHSDLYNGWI